MYIIALIVILLFFKTIIIAPNELDEQDNYIQNNITYTKAAYGVDIEEITLDVPRTIEKQDININQEVINNIQIVSKDLNLKDLNASQTAKGYYTYKNVGVGEYYIDGEKSLIYVTPREIVNYNATYNNKTYEYTHGYSVILSSASSLLENGNLNHIQKSFGDTNEKITIVEPRIYFGMQTNSTIVTNTKNKTEFDYPILNTNKVENEENTYNGTAGLKLNFLDRIILSIKQGDLKLAFSSNISNDSKILINRNIIKRAKTIMPYLMYDENPYIVITEEGKLVWVLDAYTTSNAYPYSQKTILNKTEINYIRNSVKVLIDAYDGTMKFYITDRTDPIAMTYEHMYPDVFASKNESIPSDILAHLVYPEFLYKIQADIITRYHNVETSVLYRGDDIWKIATNNTGKVASKTGTNIEPYYAFIKTVDRNSAKLSLTLPYTPYGKQNLISYFTASYDEAGNANLKIYKYPSDSNILGPMQLDTQIEQDKTISEELDNLRKVDGTKIIKNMIILPIKDTILYVEPIYQQYLNEKDINETAPILKKVIVASGNKVAIGDNLKQALSNLVSKYAVDIEVQSTDSLEDLVNAIIKANNNLTNSNNSDNWEMIGKDIKKLQELINKLEIVVEENKKNEDSNTSENIDTNILMENTVNYE